MRARRRPNMARGGSAARGRERSIPIRRCAPVHGATSPPRRCAGRRHRWRGSPRAQARQARRTGSETPVR
ncbi:MAG TPA: hypothetical protein DDY29_07980 [Rhodobacteraceae bacterium]|nr:hypothetical protein [Paracoccaceae bacterium]